LFFSCLPGSRKFSSSSSSYENSMPLKLSSGQSKY
jgi:hypothetical protein